MGNSVLFVVVMFPQIESRQEVGAEDRHRQGNLLSSLALVIHLAAKILLGESSPITFLIASAT